MSSALYQAVPNVLSGPNYLEWAQGMKSYLMAQAMWHVIITSQPAAAADDRKDWDAKNVQAIGILRLHITTSILSAVDTKDTAVAMWKHFQDNYGKPGIPIVYQDFRAAIALTVPSDSNPVPALDKLEAHFQRLETNKFDISEHVKGMMLMSKLPPSMDSTIQVYTSGLTDTATTPTIKLITLAGVRQAIIMHWEQRQGRHALRNNATKIVEPGWGKGPTPGCNSSGRSAYLPGCGC